MYEEYQNKIEILNNQLHDDIYKFKQEMLEYYEQNLQEVINNHNNGTERLKLSNQRIYESESKVNEHLDSLKSIINNLRTELKIELDNFKKEHILEDVKIHLFKEKEEALAAFKQEKKKKTAELNQKIKHFDQQCLQRIKANNLELEDIENKYKQRLVEMEKKTRFAVRKVNDEILTPGMTARQAQISGNSNTLSNEEVRNIRLNGIMEIRDIKTKYYQERKDIQLKYYEESLKYQKENEILREEYNLRIEKLKYLKTKEQRELQIGLDEYDFQIYKQLDEIEKNDNLKYNEIKANYLEKIYDNQNEIHNKINEKNQQKKIGVNNLYGELAKEDKQNLLSLHTSFSHNTEKIKNNLQIVENYMIELLSNQYNIIIYIVATFWEKYFTHQEKLFELIHSISYKSGFQYDYSVNENKILNLAKDFQNKQNKNFAQMQRVVSDNFKLIRKSYSDVFKSLINYFGNEEKSFNIYFASINQLVNAIEADAKESYQVLFEHESDENSGLFQKIKNNEQEEKSALEANNKYVKDTFAANVENLNKKIKEYNVKSKKTQKNDLLLYKSEAKKLRKNINQIKKKYKNQLNNLKRKTIDDYKKEIKAVIEESKTKTKISKI